MSGLTVDPLQDLVVIVSWPHFVFVTYVEQDPHIFWVEFQSASFQRPHPDSFCASRSRNGVPSMRAVFCITQATESVCLAVKWPMLFLDIVPPNLDKGWEDSPSMVTSMSTSGTSISEPLIVRKIRTIQTRQTFSSASLVV